MALRKELEVMTASEVTKVSPTIKADTDLSTFQAELASLPNGYYIIGQVAVPYDTSTIPLSSVVVVKPLGDVIKRPKGYRQVWNEKGSAQTEKISIWHVEAPEGYVALGDVVVSGHEKPTEAFSDRYACIKRELLAPGQLSTAHLWNDHGSKAYLGCSLWQVEHKPYSPGLAGFFKAVDSYERPQDEVYVLPVDVTSKE